MLRMYDFKCTKCKPNIVIESIVSEDEQPVCPVCGGGMDRMPPVVRVNMGPAGAYGYYDENLGTYVRTNRHRQDLCQKHGVTPKGDTPKPNGQAWV